MRINQLQIAQHHQHRVAPPQLTLIAAVQPGQMISRCRAFGIVQGTLGIDEFTRRRRILRHLPAKVHLSQQQTTGLKLGDDATLTFTGQDEPSHGKVSLISPALDAGSTTLEVWVTVPNKAGKYKAGTPVHVSLASRTLPDALTVPNEAIIITKS